MDDELITVNRGGTNITLVKAPTHNAPSIIIGHLDNEGREILEEKLSGDSTIEEIVEFFKNYVPQSGIKLDIRRSKSKSCERDISECKEVEVSRAKIKPRNNEKVDTKNMNVNVNKSRSNVDMKREETCVDQPNNKNERKNEEDNHDKHDNSNKDNDSISNNRESELKNGTEIES